MSIEYNLEFYLDRWRDLGKTIGSTNAPAIKNMSSYRLGGLKEKVWSSFIQKLYQAGKIPRPPDDKEYIRESMELAQIGHLYQDPDVKTPVVRSLPKLVPSFQPLQPTRTSDGTLQFFADA